ncbi:MAG: deoxyribonuclease V [Xanthomonadaceae bacterium]|jgi:deoxyribonuclease V|nr:deoxyribonuclease V [Xanthomonadaceae bacterium]
MREQKTGTGFPDWDGSTASARALQSLLAEQVTLSDEVASRPQRIAGFDVGFEENGTITRAAAVLLHAENLLPLQFEVVRLPTSMPYIPGLLSFRELPALLAALRLLDCTPDLAFIDGQGIAHPRRFGIAAHFGVVTGLPSIGVAKKPLTGKFAGPGPDRGDHAPLMHHNEQIGWALRSKPHCNPLIVSPGHRISVASSAEWTMRYVTRYRLPEPTRLADRLASRKGEMPAIVDNGR